MPCSEPHCWVHVTPTQPGAHLSQLVPLQKPALAVAVQLQVLLLWHVPWSLHGVAAPPGHGVAQSPPL
jgi:hypothetical protein